MSDPILEVRDLHMRFPAHRAGPAGQQRGPRAELRAVDGVSLALGRGEALGVVGESGCGKSTVARCIVGLYQPATGEIRFSGVPLTLRRAASDRRRIQMVFQDPYSSLNPRMTAGQAIGELLSVHHVVPKAQVRARTLELLDLVGLSPATFYAFPRQLSGGQRQRVSIARALALEPDILIADEPVSALDVSVQATILTLLSELRRRLGLSLVLISHDLAVVRHVCERVAVMYLGRIVETAPAEELFTRPRHPYTQALLRAVPRLVGRRNEESPALTGDPPSPFEIPEGCRFNPRCQFVQAICYQIEPPLLDQNGSAPDLTSAHVAACHFAWEGLLQPRGSAQKGSPYAPGAPAQLGGEP